MRDGIGGGPSDADSNDAFRAGYPECFNQPDCEANTLHQRFRRARDDVKALLQAESPTATNLPEPVRHTRRVSGSPPARLVSFRP